MQHHIDHRIKESNVFLKGITQEEEVKLKKGPNK